MIDLHVTQASTGNKPVLSNTYCAQRSTGACHTRVKDSALVVKGFPLGPSMSRSWDSSLKVELQTSDLLYKQR